MQRWPPYFQPTPGLHETDPHTARMPVALLDLFFLAKTNCLIAVLACLGGSLVAMEKDSWSTLPPSLQMQLTTALVQRRGHVRVLRARELFISTLTAVEHATNTSGLNDPVAVYGSMQAVLTHNEGHSSIASVACEGRSIVGRIDLAYTTLLSTRHRFGILDTSNDYVYHMLLPLASTTSVMAGEGLAIFYPILDPAHVASPDNSFALLGIIYDVLVHMQADLYHEAPQHPLVNMVLPVPSRHRLESDLQHDGYEIRGDTAVRQRAPTISGGSGFLNRLRALAEPWFAAQIILPPQSSIEVYTAIIQNILPSLLTAEDRAMCTVLDAAVSMAPEAVSQGSSSSSPHSSVGQSSAGQSTMRLSTLPKERATVKPDHERIRTFQWAGDFAATTPHTSSPHRTTRDEWLNDMHAEQRAQAKPLSASNPYHEWKQDFTPSPRSDTCPDEDDWSNDFT